MKWGVVALVAVVTSFWVYMWVSGKDEMKHKAPLLVEDSGEGGALPKRFRTMQGTSLSEHINTKGLEKIRASGSGAFTQGQLQAVKQKIHSPAVNVVDLRQESHGFVNGMGISWYGVENAANEGKSQETVVAEEKSQLESIRSTKQVEVARIEDKSGGVIRKYTTSSFPVDQVQTEEEIATLLGMGYTRFTVQDHTAPSNEQVDGYIKLIRDLPKDGWLHVHCRGGKGRTTTFLTVYDMMMNAKDVSLEDIIARQHALGGSDLLEEEDDEYKQDSAAARKAFIIKFYDYAKENNDGFKTLWSEWLKQHG